jgi:hypothetical protein
MRHSVLDLVNLDTQKEDGCISGMLVLSSDPAALSGNPWAKDSAVQVQEECAWRTKSTLPTDDVSSLCCIDTHNRWCCRTMPAPILWDHLLEDTQIKACRVLPVYIIKQTPTPIRHTPQTRATLKIPVVTTQRQHQATTQRLLTQSQTHLQAGTMEFRCSPCHKKNQATRLPCKSTCC